MRNLNRIYIDGADSLLEGFKLVMIAIETEDGSLIRPANEYLEKGRLENERWRNELIALAGKHGVKPEKRGGKGRSGTYCWEHRENPDGRKDGRQMTEDRKR